MYKEGGKGGGKKVKKIKELIYPNGSGRRPPDWSDLKFRFFAYSGGASAASVLQRIHSGRGDVGLRPVSLI